MQSFCLGQVISGAIKGAILTGISVLIGYLVIGLGAPFYLFLVAAFTISSIAIMGGFLDLAVGIVFGLIGNWIVFGMELIPDHFTTLILENLDLYLEDPPKSLGILLPGWVFVLVLFVSTVLLSFLKPGPDDENAFLFISLGVGIVAGLIFFIVYREQLDIQFVESLSLYGAVLGFIGGMLPGSPL